jgi:sensor histidine kinase YesM
VFGSKQGLVQQKQMLLAIQMLFIGSVFAFGIYYLMLFVSDKKNKTALFFSMVCLTTALRAFVWGEIPLGVFVPNFSIELGLFINYMTLYNLFPMIILFVVSLYPLDYKKKTLGIILLPTLLFEWVLMTPSGFRAMFTSYLYVFFLLQLLYIIYVLIKAVLNKRENAVVLLIAMGIFCLTIIADRFQYKAIGSFNLSYMFLYGNFVVIIAMSYIQIKLQANNHKKLILYNEKLIEADALKDKIMATEMSFLQAQIKPHFLYNALNTIACVCQEDGEKGSKLIIDLSIYLRRSLEFNALDKMSSIENELEFVDTYFNIEQTRFGEKIQLCKDINVPLHYQIPVLILQPLVENAVRHGVCKKIEGGAVHVRINPTNEGISVEIEDEGIGIEHEKLTRLLNQDRIEQGVGLLNIHHRLLRLYGRGLDIRSELEQGTCVRLVIPQKDNIL